MKNLTIARLLIFGNIIGWLGLFKYAQQQNFPFWHVVYSPTVVILVGFAIALALILVVLIYYVFASMKYLSVAKIQEVRPKSSRPVSWDRKIFIWDTLPLIIASFLFTANAIVNVMTATTYLYISVLYFLAISILFSAYINFPSVKTEKGIKKKARKILSFELIFFYLSRQVLLSIVVILLSLIYLPVLYSWILPYVEQNSLTSELAYSVSFAQYAPVLFLLFIQLPIILVANFALSSVKPNTKVLSVGADQSEAPSQDKHADSRQPFSWDKVANAWHESKGELAVPFITKPFAFLFVMLIVGFWSTDGAANVTGNALIKVDVATRLIDVSDVKRERWSSVRLAGVADSLSHDEALLLEAVQFRVLFRGSNSAVLGIYTCKDTFRVTLHQCQSFERRVVQISADSLLLKTYRVVR